MILVWGLGTLRASTLHNIGEKIRPRQFSVSLHIPRGFVFWNSELNRTEILWCAPSMEWFSPIILHGHHWCYCSGSAGASVVAHSVALPLIEIAFSTLDCSIVPTCGAWGSATAAKGGPLKQSWVGIQHSRDGEPLGVLMQMRNARVNGFFFFSSLGVLPGVLVDTLSLCSGNFCVECVLIVLHKFYIEL